MGLLTDDGRELLLRLDTKLSELPFFADAEVVVVTSLAVFVLSLSAPFEVGRSEGDFSGFLRSSAAKDLGTSTASKAGMLRRRNLLGSSEVRPNCISSTVPGTLA